MVVLEVDDFLKGAGIEEIKTIDTDILIRTRVKGRFTVEIKDDEERTGIELEKKCRAHIDFLVIQKICSLIHEYWEQIQNEINPDSDEQDELAEDDPEKYEPKYHFNTFEEWQLKVEDAYHELHKTVDDNLAAAWPVIELTLSVKAILHIKEITLPFICIVLGPPSGNKTIPIESLRGKNHTFYTDGFNAHAVISHVATLPKGMKEGDQHMLLKMKNKLVLAPELAPIFAKPKEELSEIISIFTRIADGRGLENDSGLGHKGISGKNMFVMVGAAVEIPPYVYALLTSFGPKLFFFRLSKTRKTHDQYVQDLKGEQFTIKFQKIQAAMGKYLDVFESCPTVELEENSHLFKISLDKFKPNNDEDALDIIVYLGQLLKHLRAVVWTREKPEDKDGETDFAFNVSVIEEQDRANVQLKNLTLGHALSQGRTSIAIEDVPITVRVALSTAPQNRYRVLEKLLENGGTLTTKEIEDSLHIYRTTARKAMTELKAVGLVDEEQEQGGSEHSYKITLKTGFEWFKGPEFKVIQEDNQKRYHEYLQKFCKKAETEAESKNDA